MQRRVLVTGCAGFIGSEVALQCAGLGWSVVGVDDLNPYYDQAQKRANLEMLRASHRAIEVHAEPLEDYLLDKARKQMRDFDVVFHLAGQPGVRASWEEGFGEYVDRNIVLTKALLDAMVDGHARLVISSSSSVYGNSLSYPVTEEYETRPVSPYGVTKLAAERLSLAYAENSAVDVAVLRYFTVFGPRQRPDMAINRLIRSALHGTDFVCNGDGEQMRDFTYVGDVVSANIAAALRSSSTPVVANICGGTSVTLNEVISVVEKLAGHSIHLVRASEARGDVRQTGGSHALAQRVLGWNPDVGLEEGIAREVDWLRGAH